MKLKSVMMAIIALNGLAIQQASARDFIEPAPNEVVARVSGTEVMARDIAPPPIAAKGKSRTMVMVDLKNGFVRQLTDVIWKGLRERIVIENKIKATAPEIANYVKIHNRDKKRRISSMDKISINSKAESEILRWKADYHLYMKYHGQLAQKDFQTIPVEAYVKYLKDLESQGEFEIHHSEFKELFYAQYSPPNVKFVSVGNHNTFESPSWLK